jgi:hypothetical protein
MWTLSLVRRDILATAGLQSRIVDTQHLSKVDLVRSTPEWLYNKVGIIREFLPFKDLFN